MLSQKLRIFVRLHIINIYNNKKWVFFDAIFIIFANFVTQIGNLSEKWFSTTFYRLIFREIVFNYNILI